MCGIAGAIMPKTEINSLPDKVEMMIDAQKQRGPNGHGVDVVNTVTPTVIFGHCRLAIIDLSSAGHQPMCDSDTGNWITFNGEIYNFRELRGKLEEQGQVFRTQTDTEVILKAYATWGLTCAAKLRGIFAFGIWDQQQRRLFLARDQLGVKPLYFYHDNKYLFFASEVRALLASGLIPRHLDIDGLSSYLRYGSVQEPNTLVKEVHSLPPGHILTWQNGKIEKKCYWQLPRSTTISYKPSDDIYEELNSHLTEAVGVQLVADVPLGAFLSGGIDSTAIAALMRGRIETVKTFSIIFDEAAYDERAYARIAASHIGTEHHELLLTSQIMQEHLDNALHAFDQPSMDGLNTYFVAKITREAGLTVALSGVGGDELFGGYAGYQRPLQLERWHQRLRYVPETVRRLLANLSRFAPQTEIVRRGADLLRTTTHPYALARQVFNEGQIAGLLQHDLVSQNLGEGSWWQQRMDKLYTATADYDSINRASALELQTYMLSTLLRDTDQMSMAHALEVRVPLLDHKLVEALFQLPGSSKLSNTHPKPLLTQTLGTLLPYECVYRAKQGFTFPFELWLRQHMYQTVVNSFTSQQAVNAYPFDSNGLQWLWQQFEQRRIGWSRVWAIFVLRCWLNEHQVHLA